MFRGLFGGVGGGSMNSPIDDLLTNEETTLEQLLDENELSNECKFGNQNLKKFFNREKIMRLIEFITVMPSENDDDKRAKKFPFMSNEIFSSEQPFIIDMFFTAPTKRKPGEI